MAEHLLASKEELHMSIAVGESKLMQIEAHKVLVFHLSEGFYATSHQCTHLFKSLDKGLIVSDKTVRCPLHRAEFDIRTGEVDTWACFPKGLVNIINTVRTEKALSTYALTERDEQYYISLPD